MSQNVKRNFSILLGLLFSFTKLIFSECFLLLFTVHLAPLLNFIFSFPRSLELKNSFTIFLSIEKNLLLRCKGPLNHLQFIWFPYFLIYHISLCLVSSYSLSLSFLVQIIFFKFSFLFLVYLLFPFNIYFSFIIDEP